MPKCYQPFFEGFLWVRVRVRVREHRWREMRYPIDSSQLPPSIDVALYPRIDLASVFLHLRGFSDDRLMRTPTLQVNRESTPSLTLALAPTLVLGPHGSISD